MCEFKVMKSFFSLESHSSSISVLPIKIEVIKKLNKITFPFAYQAFSLTFIQLRNNEMS